MSLEEQIKVELRLWSSDDFVLLERLMGDPIMTAHLGGPETPEQLRNRHERYCQTKDSDTSQMFVILAGSQPAGSIGYWEKLRKGEFVWETGWSVLPEFQGKGIATQATLALIDKVRQLGRYQFLHAYPSVDNLPSNALCKKVGFTLIEQAKFEYPPGNWMECNDWRIDLFENKVQR